MVTRYVKLFLSILTLFILWFNRTLRKLAEAGSKTSLVVLNYHCVKPDQRELFARQMEMLLDVGTPAFAEVDTTLSAHEHCIAVCFDDGFQSVVENALPIMYKLSIPSTIFVPVGYLGCLPGWIINSQHENAREILLTREQLRALPADLVRVGSHSISHLKLTALEPCQARSELLESRTRLSEILDREVELFSFPYDECSLQLVENAKQCGYKKVFCNAMTFPDLSSRPYLVGRVDVSPADWRLEYWLKLKGAYLWIPLARGMKRRLTSFLNGKTSPRKGAEK